ncbi:hypothetical protein [Piscinibacter sp.]|uniref:hypothetical protein n=1 Tax=Piscinibacter sp. TaxID=1903157 RepID=UPI0039E6017A
MNPFAALDHQPPALQPVQLLLMGVFLTAYLAAVTSLLDPRGRMRAAGIALAAGIGMGFVFTPWTLGALLAAASVGAIGVFIGLSWVLSRALGVHDRAPVVEGVAPEPESLESFDAAGAGVPHAAAAAVPVRAAPRLSAHAPLA